MKLKNKKTGEIVDFAKGNFISSKDYGFVIYKDGGRSIEYSSLAELNEEWCDYEEPKSGIKDVWFPDVIEGRNNVVISFETREEAEKAVEKLKAFKRLKDKGFDFVGCFKDNTINYEFVERPLDYDEAEEAEQDLAFLFGGEE